MSQGVGDDALKDQSLEGLIRYRCGGLGAGDILVGKVYSPKGETELTAGREIAACHTSGEKAREVRDTS